MDAAHIIQQRTGGQNSWGSRQLLTNDPLAGSRGRAIATMVSTDLLRVPKPIALQFRFQGPAVAATNFQLLDSGWQLFAPVDLRVTINRGIDVLGGATTDVVDVPVGEQVPIALVLAHKLTVTVALNTGSTTGFWCEVIAAPLDAVDFSALLGGPGGELGGYGTANVTRVAAAAADTLLLNSNDARRQFLIVNNSVQDLAVKFGLAPSLGAGAESFSVLLPGGVSAQYESPIGGYTGVVRGIWAAADAAGEALVTEGVRP